MPRDLKGKLTLSGREPDEESPDTTLLAVDADGEEIFRTRIEDGDEFSLSESTLAKADRIYLGPVADDEETVRTDELAVFRPAHVRELLREAGEIEIPRDRWGRWTTVRICTSGSVRHCFPFPWLLRDLYNELIDPGRIQFPRRRIERTAESSVAPQIEAAELLPWGIYIRHPYRCRPVCEGVVEVYRRLCCCEPFIVYDPRLEEILERLRRVPEPPFPLPDPPPLREIELIKGGAIDPFVLNARRDLARIEELSPHEQVEYINARPYLYCFERCGRASKVAQGFIQPDGTFAFCWKEPRQLIRLGCHFEYAYRVKQVVDGVTVTIYDGLKSNQWFDGPQDAQLVSYHRKALHCDDSNVPDPGVPRYALLERIGDTDSYNLHTPLPTDEDSVASPLDSNHGLAFPIAGDAKGQYKNRNWGGTLPLYFKFSESLKTVATHYRVSVVSAPNGSAVGAPTPLLDPVTWRRYTVPAPGVYTTEPVTLGPDGNNTFRIPYGHDWVGGRYHAYLDTTGLPEGNHLVILELFDNAGNRVTPADGFDYLRWVSVDTLTPVATDALPHLFHWDNRRSHAKILDVLGGSNMGTATCLFLEGPGNQKIRVEYEASHPEERFQHHHSLVWWRGIGSGASAWPVPAPYDNVPGPSNPPGRSSGLEIDTLLGPEEACSFGIRLHTHVKTFNGSGTLNDLEEKDQAAFALKKT